jgi:uncharacterized protein YjlB
MASSDPARHVFADDGIFPNSKLPVLIYRRAVEVAALGAPSFEEMFEANHWSASWRNGLFGVHHYHSTAHEVLGIFRGWVRARLGGEKGTALVLEAGDVIVIPAGVAHKNEGASADFRVVGAYAGGIAPDMNYGKPGERPGTDRNIAGVPHPAADPVAGKKGPLTRLW